jgi:enoyl-CoA hydratase/carnithine racemase/thioesterase domain-containing protein
MSTAAAVLACDSADGRDATALVCARPLDGALHAAGVLRDRLLHALSAEDLHTSCCPKAAGASHLHSAVSAWQPLEAFGLFSSIASTFGSMGQANYTAANAYLDALASSLRRCGMLGSSLQIPAVSGAGMGARTFDEEQLEAMGAVSLDEFAACLAAALGPARAAVERTQAPLVLQTIEMLDASSLLLEKPLDPLFTCEEEALVTLQDSTLPRSTGGYILLRVSDGVALLELNDPSHFNAISIEMASDMQAAVAWLTSQERDAIKSVVVQGAGPHFCPGGNMYRSSSQGPSSLEAAARASIDFFDGFCRLRTLPCPVTCAAHGAVLGGGMAITLLTDHVTCNDAATFQVGERSREIHPAGLFTQTLADAVGTDVAVELYLSDDQLTGAQAREVGVVQAVTPSVRSAQQLADGAARRFASSVVEARSALQLSLQALSGKLPPCDRRNLAVNAFAQARSLEVKASGVIDGHTGAVFSSSDAPLVRGRLRTAVQAALSAAQRTLHGGLDAPKWSDVSYARTASHDPAEGALQQLMRALAVAQTEQPQASSSALATEAAVEERQVDVTTLAARFTDSFTPDAVPPLHMLMDAYDGLAQGMPAQSGSSSGGAAAAREPLVVDEQHPCLLLLRDAKEATGRRPPLIIAHSLLGDHRGYGRLWSTAAQQSRVFALRHRRLTGADAYALDHDGAASMAGEYAAALVGALARGAFDLIGASFGAVLASHVACAAKAAGGYHRRLLLIDPPPAVPEELPMPQMLRTWRLAAMGVLLLHLDIEMGANVWTQFPQLQTLPEAALACFVAAQLLPEGASKAELVVWVERVDRLLVTYRQCRHAFHIFSASIEAIRPHVDDSPSVLMALSSERLQTFLEMFPGVKEDAVGAYGPAATVQLPGQHIAMINRCLANRDAGFTDALERCAATTPPLARSSSLNRARLRATPAGSVPTVFPMRGGGRSGILGHMRTHRHVRHGPVHWPCRPASSSHFYPC